MPSLPPLNRYPALLDILRLRIEDVDTAVEQTSAPANRAIALSYPFEGEDDSDRKVYYSTYIEAIRIL